ncbi:hypothetical protein TorRG33x02_228180, partial [Trema orientale]
RVTLWSLLVTNEAAPTPLTVNYRLKPEIEGPEVHAVVMDFHSPELRPTSFHDTSSTVGLVSLSSSSFNHFRPLTHLQ